MERLLGEYNRGYREAIMDVTEVFRYIQPDLKRHHRSLNSKLAMELLRVILENREALRDDWSGFIRFNGASKKFEYYRTRKEK